MLALTVTLLLSIFPIESFLSGIVPLSGDSCHASGEAAWSVSSSFLSLLLFSSVPAIGGNHILLPSDTIFPWR